MRQLWVLMLLMALAFVNDRCHCCLEEERIGLLEIKAWFSHAPQFYELHGWDKEHFNCCNWYRVACDHTANRVIGLDLSYVNSAALEDLYLNASLFLPFKELEILDLSANQLVGGLRNQGFQGLSSGLRKLKDLVLHYNKFNDNIVSSLSGFSSLESLALSDNSFTGAIGLRGLRKLEVLYLDTSNFKESILLESLGGLPSLKTLYARQSKFKEKHFGKVVQNLTKLEELFLDYSLSPITTSFLCIIGPLLALKTLSLEGCMINGTLPHQGWCELKNLERLNLAQNNLKGILPPCLGNLSSLRYLDLSKNNLSGSLSLGFDAPYLPKGGSNNNFKGRLPPSVLNMTNLEYLFLDGNKFEGEVLGTFSLAESSLQLVDISNNLLSGMLPRGIGNSSIFLKVIDLSRNYFEGTIPIEYFNSPWIEYLDLSENNLSGSLPLGFKAPHLRYFRLYRNQLSGPLPDAFFNLSSLVTVDLSDNNLTGPIPNWIDSLSNLSIFVLKSNQFIGELPHQLCLLRKLSILDLSENNFSGHLLSCLSNLNFTASDDKYGFFYYTRSTVDLSCNRFTGEIPAEWGNLSLIHSLNLSQNNLTGLIPSSFSNLKQIESLDLSHNNLNGRIPAQIIELNFLAVFNVSYNTLSGKIPERKHQFANFDESSYKGNPLLCGPPLGNSCDKTESPLERVSDNSIEDDGSIDMDSFYVSFSVCYISVVWTILAVLCINPHWRCRWFYFIEKCIDTCYCVLAINFRKFFRSRR